MNSLRIETQKYIPKKHMFDTIEFFKTGTLLNDTILWYQKYHKIKI